MNGAFGFGYCQSSMAPARHDLSEVDALTCDAEASARLMISEDAIEGPRAFLEKRPPVFAGR